MTWTKEQQKEYMKNRNKEHPELHRNYAHAWRAARRLEIINLLGGQCINPYGLHDKPFTDIRCLQIDHINGGGTRERRTGIFTSNKYPQIIKFIKENPHQTKYQLLCANCNWIKRDKNME